MNIPTVQEINTTLTKHTEAKAVWENSQASTDYWKLHALISEKIRKIYVNNMLESFELAGNKLILDVEDRFGDPITCTIEPDILFNKTAQEIKDHEANIHKDIHDTRVTIQNLYTKEYIQLRDAMSKLEHIKQVDALKEINIATPKLPDWYTKTATQIQLLEDTIQSRSQDRWMK